MSSERMSRELQQSICMKLAVFTKEELVEMLGVEFMSTLRYIKSEEYLNKTETPVPKK